MDTIKEQMMTNFHVAGPTMLVYDFYRFLAEEAGIKVYIKEEKLSKVEAHTIPMNTKLAKKKVV